MKPIKFLMLAVLIFTGLPALAVENYPAICVSGFGETAINQTWVYTSECTDPGGSVSCWIPSIPIDTPNTYFLWQYSETAIVYPTFVSGWPEGNFLTLYGTVDFVPTTILAVYNVQHGISPGGIVTEGACTPAPQTAFVGIMTNASTTFGSFGSLMSANVITGVSNVWPVMFIMLGTFLAFVILFKIQDFIMTTAKDKGKKEKDHFKDTIYKISLTDEQFKEQFPKESERLEKEENRRIEKMVYKEKNTDYKRGHRTADKYTAKWS